MAFFPHFPFPPPPPVHPISPPPPHPVPPPPVHPISPPLPHTVPPPPHVIPPPPPLNPDNGPTVIVVVFISFGGVFFLAFCFVALWCLIKKRKKKTVEETDIICTNEHIKLKEAIVQGPHGPQVVVLSVEEDKHVEEQIIKTEKLEGKHLHAKPGEITTTDIEAA